MAGGSKDELNILVILGSVREGRMGDRVAKFVMDKLKETSHTAELWDPLELDLPLLRQPVHFYPKDKPVPQKLQDLHARVRAADAYLVITTEYNRQLPPALTNTMNHFPPASYAWKNAGIISYSMGPQGGAIAAQCARVYLTELGCLPVSFSFTVPTVQEHFDASGATSSDRMQTGFAKLLAQLEWWAGASKAHRSVASVPS